jgi:hypothetical protein
MYLTQSFCFYAMLPCLPYNRCLTCRFDLRDYAPFSHSLSAVTSTGTVFSFNMTFLVDFELSTINSLILNSNITAMLYWVPSSDCHW